ncbi:MAG: hypothetical protein ACYSRQ_06760 [Planctomycetota bacterium]|jgi:hypothetical protein
MEREIIERLAMDSVSDELNEDTKVLLQAYLAEHSQENLWAEEMFKLYETTKAAVKTKTNQGNAEPFKTIHKNTSLRINIISLGRWAAVIIFAVAIGAGLGRLSKKPELISGPVKTVTSNSSQRLQPGDLVVMPTEGFWREKAVSMLTPKHAPHYEERIPLDQLWKRYKQFIKEKHYDNK